MPLKIKSVKKESLAAELGFQIGDTILKINGHSIDDFLDFQFYANDDFLNFQIRKKNGSIKNITLSKDWVTDLGIEIQEPE